MKNSIKEMGIHELAAQYRAKQLSPVEVTEALLKELHTNDRYNAFITVTDEPARKAAREAEERFIQGRPLSVMDGIPYAAKDIFYTKDIRTTMGSAIYKDFVPSYSASVIETLNAAGAVLIGKTNTHEFASGGTSDVGYFAPVKNPHNLKKIPGGSSGGSGAAVAGHLCPAALGSDTSGSVRLPASACGIVGMRPTYGLVSKYGVYPLCDTIDSVGPMTRTVRDNAYMLNVMAAYDAKDPRSIRAEGVDYTGELDAGVGGMTVAVPYDLFQDSCEPFVFQCFEQAVSALRDAGAQVVPIANIDPAGEFTEACRIVRICEACVLHEPDMREHGDLYSPEIYEQMLGGAKYSAADYIKAVRLQAVFKARFLAALADAGADAMAIPTMPMVPTDIGQREIVIRGTAWPVHNRLGLYTIIASFTGFPALSVPTGFNGDHIPAGIQILTGPLRESTAYRIGSALENALQL